MSAANLHGGIEAGGTKFVCAVASDPPLLLSETSFGTTTPQETLERVCAYFRPYVREGRLKSIGIASFGPVDADPLSPTYGYITATPKPHWQNTNILGILQQELGVPFAFHHDVSVSAIGEHRWGASRGIDPSLYITIGTGIGGGFLLDGKPLTGLSALEMGHISVPHDRETDPFVGHCPFHGDCFEGLASGPAIEARMGRRGETLADDDPFWAAEADYIAHALTNYIFTLSPRIIVLGGGVMQRSFLFPEIRKRIPQYINGYLQFEALTSRIDRYVVPPALGKYSGVLGAISMALDLDATQQIYPTR
ncbi:MAG TPA: ROK family protein [Anaerolineaceae bacterium]|nr:ROK family protein [Anaerolineaceae bacterium]